MTPSTDLHPRLQTLLAGHRIWGQLDTGALQSLAAQWRVEPMRQGERLLRGPGVLGAWSGGRRVRRSPG